MPDLPNDFWSGWIIVLTVASLAGVTWFICSIYFGRADAEPEESTVWDETLREGENPAPMWWFWTILAALVFSVVYLMLYPGLGSYAGMMAWSQGSELEATQARFEAAFNTRQSWILDAPLTTLRAEPEAMAAAQRVFRQNCGACHGDDGAGQANAFPDLTDDAWQWGGDAGQIEHTIRKGRTAVMPGWTSVIGDEGVARVAAYLQDLRGDARAESQNESPSGSEGATLFAQFCAACHGPTGAGVAMLGGPNLVDDAWTYGEDHAQVIESIAEGRMGVMPAFDDRLSDVEIRLLVSWLMQPSR